MRVSFCSISRISLIFLHLVLHFRFRLSFHCVDKWVIGWYLRWVTTWALSREGGSLRRDRSDANDCAKLEQRCYRMTLQLTNSSKIFSGCFLESAELEELGWQVGQKTNFPATGEMNFLCAFRFFSNAGAKYNSVWYCHLLEKAPNFDQVQAGELSSAEMASWHLTGKKEIY